MGRTFDLVKVVSRLITPGPQTASLELYYQPQALDGNVIFPSPFLSVALAFQLHALNE